MDSIEMLECHDEWTLHSPSHMHDGLELNSTQRQCITIVYQDHGRHHRHKLKQSLLYLATLSGARPVWAVVPCCFATGQTSCAYTDFVRRLSTLASEGSAATSIVYCSLLSCSGLCERTAELTAVVCHGLQT